MATVLSTYDKWKQFLGERVQNARQAGMNDTTIQKLATEIGDFLAQKVDPKNDEERVLQELWAVSDENERKVLAGVMMKLVD
jgi:nuclear transport factor 2 (NTF2) superfamily protein